MRTRVRQFVAYVTARVSVDEEQHARALLPGAEYELFAAMPVADRRHALDVVGKLRGSGVTDADVLTAALLHDAAKGPRLRLWHRVVVVLVEAVTPGRLERLASRDPGSWRHPFHLHLHHAELSARAALDAGCSPRVAAFIHGTPAGPDVQLAAALRAADAAS
ncbi:MAG: hypothetical protein ACRDFR_09425 [Candidatus Limnocylindria bacterium]